MIIIIIIIIIIMIIIIIICRLVLVGTRKLAHNGVVWRALALCGHSLPLLTSNLPSAKLTSICSDFFGQEIEHAAGVYRAQNVRHQEVIDTSYEFVTLPPHPHIHCDIVDYIPVAVLQ